MFYERNHPREFVIELAYYSRCCGDVEPWFNNIRVLRRAQDERRAAHNAGHNRYALDGSTSTTISTGVLRATIISMSSEPSLIGWWAASAGT